MRHNRSGRKLGRTSAHRKALNRNLTRSLILHGRIKTTVPKAKEMIPFASRLVTLAKEGSLSARRRAIELMGESEAVAKLFNEMAPKFADRPGGYVRMIRLPFGRLGDKAPVAFVEFVEEEAAEVEETAKKKKKGKKLSKKAKREQAKKERKKHDLQKRAEAAKAEAEEAQAAEEEQREEESEEAEETATDAEEGQEVSSESETTNEADEPSEKKDSAE